MKYIFWFLGIVMVTFIALSLYANLWGQSHCNKANGNWVEMNGGLHCVDSGFKEIDIYH